MITITCNPADVVFYAGIGFGIQMLLSIIMLLFAARSVIKEITTLAEEKGGEG